ncbi:MAG: hypothetical protein A2381_15755 [Bdellovibrionales bacterium RIFOXYB1_FULL_37_110]|nr:MAG: hypothetical protein A2417_07605 [Bdellovibrionales bacterium RIFOXYC1_FULL_37_79]OFZ57070.1 MAG: hypothetical protein A2381_15755 [Bdellovibrionales bacterium RIFOXYB1_FULL_37_110]OFZ62079.1 MAG: hypothetical protein A2577_08475 [Bdellovibrionales bacterium RIFOXYD1_FULL_36_51]
MKNTLMLIITLIMPSLIFAQINIQDRIKTQKFFKKAYPVVFGKKVYQDTEKPLDKKEIVQQNQLALSDEFIKKINAHPIIKEKERIHEFIKDLDSTLPEEILRPLTYWKFIQKNPANVETTLAYYILYKILILRDHIDNPLSEDEDSAATLLSEFCDNQNTGTRNIFDKCTPGIFQFAKEAASLSDPSKLVEAIKSNHIINTKLRDRVSSINSYSLSYLGIIPGNQVEIISRNDTSMERMNWLNERYMFSGGVFDFNAPYIKMPTDKDPNGHIIFQKNGDPIYKRIREMIDRANDSIFIDIFLFGGTLGMTLAEYLLDECIKKINTNKNFKLFILHDYATNYNMVEEMLPVFRYVRDRLKNEPTFHEKGFLIQANIHRHPPGIPFELTSLLIHGIKNAPDFNEAFKTIEKGNTYIESKIDHSKVIVIDPNSDHPEAYFGSKNWTDHSGGYYYDNAIYVKGPAAALVQASYYDDLDAALTTDKKEQRWFYYKERDNGSYDNQKYIKLRDQILNSFKVTRTDPYPMQKDNEPLRIAEANVDGTIKDVRNILIDMIKKAEKNIYMEQLFIYDPYINDALMKRKLEIPSLDIKILADHNGNFGLNGLPNTIFIKEMQSYKIEIKARKTFGLKHRFNENFEKEYHQENHRKITSVDGEVLLGGSSNLNPDTLQGSFREFGAQIFDKKQIAIFEQKFLSDWEAADATVDFDIENFQVKLSGKLLPPELSALINDLGATIFRNKDRLEKRY